MPAGPGPIGFAAFAGVKFAGYVLASSALRAAYKSSQNVWKVGAARTAIGIGFGAAFGGIWILLSTRLENRWPDWLAGTAFFGLLLPIRFVEWSLLIHWFFDRGLGQRTRDLKYSMLGILWSFVLDAAGIVFAFVVPGGFWIC
jgi:hypothetical protein